MKQILRFNKIIKSIIIAGDLCILNALFVTLYYVLDTDTQCILLSDSLPQLLVLLNLVYLLCNYSKGVVLHRRIVRADHIVMRAVRNTFCHAVVFISLITLVHFGSLSTRFLVIFYTAFLALLVLYRLIFRHFVKIYRRKGGNRRTVALVGDGSNMVELYEEMTADPTSGFKVVGYFAEHPSDNYPKECRYLGTPQEVIPYLKKSKTEQLYCGLASSHSKEIMPIISYCENNLIHFYSVPNVRNYLKRRMHLELIGSVPVLDIRQEPLAQPENRLAKRLFDIVFSLLFLCTIFPIIFIIIGLAIKITSPGPIFFKQKRSGEENKEFWCYKFRSMRVNKDSDKVQATLNDIMAETFRSLRTNLLFMLGDPDKKVILVTSTMSGEGKTFIASNLAVSLALLGKKVIIVGLDIRKPGLNKVFRIHHKEKGITGFLSAPQSTDLRSMILPSEVSNNLHVLPGGAIPPNPTELLARKSLDDAIELLKKDYDYVVLDTAPIGMVTDTQLIARVADISVYVCRADYTHKNDYQLINELYANKRLPGLCTVINGLDMKKKKYGYYYGYGKYGRYYGYGKKYGYGYGYGYGDTSDSK